MQMLVLRLFSLLFCIVNCKGNRLKINITPYVEKFYYHALQRIKFEIWRIIFLKSFYHWKIGEGGGSVVECRTPEREVGGSKPTSAVLCPWARHFTPRKYWLITQEAVAPSRHDWKIVDWDVKPQHKQTKTTEKLPAPIAR